MAAPLKPWEKAKLSNATNLRTPSSPSSLNPGLPPGRNYARQPPAPPPRPNRTTTISRPPVYSSGYGGYGSSYGFGGYGGSGMYGGMYGTGAGMYGGMNRYGGYDGNGINTFTRMAEESSRPAFQSIESIVQAFGSVSMMLESTYSAVYNSFRAVLGVADNFSNLRAQFTQVFSAFAVVKTLRYLYRKLLVLLRLRDSGLEEDLWTSAMGPVDAAGEVPQFKKNKSSWPILLFLAVVFGGPYLIWKMLSSINPKEEINWANGEDDHFVALGEFDFDAESEEELSFRAGQKIRIAPKDLQPRMRGWLLACVDGKKTGIIPANYVKLLGKRQGTKTLNQIAETRSQAISPQASAAWSESNQQANDSGPSNYQDLDDIFVSDTSSRPGGGKHVHFENETSASNASPSVPARREENGVSGMSSCEILETSQEEKPS